MEERKMVRNRELTLLGGDARMAACGQELAEQGWQVHVCGLELAHWGKTKTEGIRLCSRAEDALAPGRPVLLPVPPAEGNLLRAPLAAAPMPLLPLLERIAAAEAGPVFAGMPSTDLKRAAADRGIRLLDYMERDELAIGNAVPTAEGAVALAMARRDRVLFRARCLVLGFGRVARVLADRLQGLRADVAVAARKPADLAYIRAAGMEAVPMTRLAGVLERADVVFNTVPALLLDRTLLSVTRPEILVIDLASRPGGVDFRAAEELHRETVWALSLPGKVAPVTAGCLIAETVSGMMEELVNGKREETHP